MIMKEEMALTKSGDSMKVYEKKAAAMKKIFKKHGFRILYDKDGKEDLADGFYFNITLPGLDAEELIRRFFRCGLGTISLNLTGCKGKSGVRISTSKIREDQFPELDERLGMFVNLVDEIIH